MDNEIVFHEERRINAVHFESRKHFHSICISFKDIAIIWIQRIKRLL